MTKPSHASAQSPLSFVVERNPEPVPAALNHPLNALPTSLPRTLMAVAMASTMAAFFPITVVSIVFVIG